MNYSLYPLWLRPLVRHWELSSVESLERTCGLCGLCKGGGSEAMIKRLIVSALYWKKKDNERQHELCDDVDGEPLDPTDDLTFEDDSEDEEDFVQVSKAPIVPLWQRRRQEIPPPQQITNPFVNTYGVYGCALETRQQADAVLRQHQKLNIKNNNINDVDTHNKKNTHTHTHTHTHTQRERDYSDDDLDIEKPLVEPPHPPAPSSSVPPSSHTHTQTDTHTHTHTQIDIYTQIDN
eukprot:GHVR01190812.1.p2 GENE.GHVR01190812.1~~GHVR01190812.1.p2  ORF type:complete len:235 (+),score=114.65 GHVR01190812.1:844-1548(+)